MRLTRSMLFLATLFLSLSSVGAAQVPSRDVQVAGAVQAAPASLRDGATVLGYEVAGDLATIRQGTGDLVCLADDPGTDGFSVACYHESLEPYMARGRELRAQGVSSGAERNSIRWREIEQGKLPAPANSAFLYVLTGSAFDADAGEVADQFLRYVIYVPGRNGGVDRIADPSRGSRWTVVDGAGDTGRAHHDHAAPIRKRW